MEVFFVMKREMYSPQVKWKVIEMKKEGFSSKEIMEKLNIKNKTQVDTWWRWYRNGETHRFEQPLGKQYKYGKGPIEISELETAKKKIEHLEMELDILKKISGALKK